MTVRIRKLDAVTIGQIAAGEIIDRPASVVKELVENAIDAGATRVEVNVEGGGADLIEVIDDGAGIAAEELSLAVQRHATSKLTAAEDLESIATLGFRGEGLASIAAVARLEIASRTPQAAVGARVVAHAETVAAVEPIAVPVGTRLRVEALFKTVPVRREYLRSASAEFNRISSWLSSFALAYPHVTFTLRHDGKDVWVMPASGEPRERLAMVFGRQAARAMLPLDGAAASTIRGSVRGFISAPGNDRPDRRLQVLFVNGRLSRNAPLSAAWASGYSTYTMTGRHAFGVIFLELPSDEVDANVHPAKSEVRLRYSSQVFDAVRATIVGTLAEHARVRFRENVAANPAISFAPPASDAGFAEVQSFFGRATDVVEAPVGRLRVLTQLARTFILATDGEALLLVDQHAAHERIAYEAIVARDEDAPSEALLVPDVVELDPARSEVLDRTLDALRAGGLEIEPFGDRTYRIAATPAGYNARTFDLLGFLDDLTDDPKQRDVRERVWASLACHSVTVAGERLELDEMTTLVDRLQQCKNPMHCPHGRPTMIRFDASDIARMFKRV